MFDYINPTHEAQGMVEYGVILVLIAIVAIGAIQLFGAAVGQLFQVATDAFP